MDSSSFAIFREYGEGRRSVQEVLRVCQSYGGPEAHVLWAPSRSDFGFAVPPAHRLAVVDACLRSYPEERLYGIFRVLTDEDPDFARIRSLEGDSFLCTALDAARFQPATTTTAASVSARLLVLLSVPGTTRQARAHLHPCHSLHNACSIPGIDPAVVHRLIDLDPGVLDEPGWHDGNLPLHLALAANPLGTFIPRMLEARPDSLSRLTVRGGYTPVSRALQGAPPSPEVARVLQTLVEACPDSAKNGGSSLADACRRFHQYPDLIRAIVRADPGALGVARRGAPGADTDERRRLPLEFVAEAGAAAAPETRDLVEAETLEVALAVLENALGASAFSPPRGRYEVTHLATFRRHAWRTARAYLPDAPDPDRRWRRAGTSGFAVARALRRLDGDRRRDLCRDLLAGHGRTRHLLRGDASGVVGAQAFREDVMGAGGMALYRLNRRSRRSSPSPARQVVLLESVNDNLDCLFLHFRAVACAILVVDGR